MLNTKPKESEQHAGVLGVGEKEGKAVFGGGEEETA